MLIIRSQEDCSRGIVWNGKKNSWINVDNKFQQIGGSEGS